jgi:hypothetical protein
VLKTRQILNWLFLEVLEYRQILRVGGFFHRVFVGRVEGVGFCLFFRRFSKGVGLGGLDLCKILRGLFLEWLILPKILKVLVFFHSVCGWFFFDHDDTTARRQRKLATKNTNNTKAGRRDLRFEILDFSGGRELATNEHK